MLMAITGHRSMHPPQPVHLAVSIVTIHLLLWMLFVLSKINHRERRVYEFGVDEFRS